MEHGRIRPRRGMAESRWAGTYPKVFGPESAPLALLQLVHELMPRLIEGEHPVLAALRQQYAHASVRRLELTGTGFLADFQVPDDGPVASPPDFAGGYVPINLVAAHLGAGCVLYVRDGLVSTLEGFTYDDEWPESAAVQSIGDGVPIEVNTTLHQHATLGRVAEVAWSEYPAGEGSRWGSKVLAEVVRRLKPRCLVVNLLGLDDGCGMPLVGSLVSGAVAVRELDDEGVTRIVAVKRTEEILKRYLRVTGIGPHLHLTICRSLDSALVTPG